MPSAIERQIRVVERPTREAVERDNDDVISLLAGLLWRESRHGCGHGGEQKEDGSEPSIGRSHGGAHVSTAWRYDAHMIRATLLPLLTGLVTFAITAQPRYTAVPGHMAERSTRVSMPR